MEAGSVFFPKNFLRKISVQSSLNSVSGFTKGDFLKGNSAKNNEDPLQSPSFEEEVPVMNCRCTLTRQ